MCVLVSRGPINHVRKEFAAYILSDGDQLVDYFETDEPPAKALRRLRNAARMTLQQVGDKIGVSMARVNDYESGRRAISKAKAKMLCELFHAPVALFV